MSNAHNTPNTPKTSKIDATIAEFYDLVARYTEVINKINQNALNMMYKNDDIYKIYKLLVVSINSTEIIDGYLVVYCKSPQLIRFCYRAISIKFLEFFNKLNTFSSQDECDKAFLAVVNFNPIKN